MGQALCASSARAAASRISGLVLGLLVFAALQNSPARADTMSEALARAYIVNPQLRAQRADTRATDENLPNALSGYRPTVSAAADGGLMRDVYTIPGPNGGKTGQISHPANATLQVTENLFNGFRTQNQVALAQSQILSSRETLRYTQLSVLASAAAAYMDVLRDAAILKLRKDNVRFLERQLESTRTRLKDGDVTRTDLAQSEEALSQGRVDQAIALTNLKKSVANYVKAIGDTPKFLAPAKPPAALLPHSLEDAFRIAEAEHPLILAALHNVDAAQHAVAVAEGQLLPTLNAVASGGQYYDYLGVAKEKYFNATIGLQLNIPLYQGGSEYSAIRQAREKLEQAQAQLDQERLQVRASVIASFAAWKNSRIVIFNARKEEQQAEHALADIRQEARLGLRTTFDILYAQQSLVNARITVVTAQHDRVIEAYSLLAAIGRLSARRLHLDAPYYDPTVHYNKVKYKWFGTEP